jgi:hypothetical protein
VEAQSVSRKPRGASVASGTPLYGLTNWSTETYAPALERFAFLQWFRGILVSGEVKVIKPDRRIFELLIERFGIDPHSAVYIDDVEALCLCIGMELLAEAIIMMRRRSTRLVAGSMCGRKRRPQLVDVKWFSRGSYRAILRICRMPE